jgi:hypothetical protein
MWVLAMMNEMILHSGKLYSSPNPVTTNTWTLDANQSILSTNYCSLRHNLSFFRFCLNRLFVGSCSPCSIWEVPCCSCAIVHQLYDWLKIEIMQLDSDYATPMVVVRSTVELGMKWLCLLTIDNNEC